MPIRKAARRARFGPRRGWTLESARERIGPNHVCLHRLSPESNALAQLRRRNALSSALPRLSRAGRAQFFPLNSRPNPRLCLTAAQSRDILGLKHLEALMRIACLGGGPAGLYFAISMKLRDPAHEIDLYRAQPARRHVRLGRRLLRPDGRESDGQRSRVRRRDPGRIRPLGRYRGPHPRRDDPLLGPRLHRHRPQAAA